MHLGLDCSGIKFYHARVGLKKHSIHNLSQTDGKPRIIDVRIFFIQCYVRDEFLSQCVK